MKFIPGKTYTVRFEKTINHSWWGKKLKCLDYNQLTDVFTYEVETSDPMGGMRPVGRKGIMARASLKLISCEPKRSHLPKWW